MSPWHWGRIEGSSSSAWKGSLPPPPPRPSRTWPAGNRHLSCCPGVPPHLASSRTPSRCVWAPTSLLQPPACSMHVTTIRPPSPVRRAFKASTVQLAVGTARQRTVRVRRACPAPHLAKYSSSPGVAVRWASVRRLPNLRALRGMNTLSQFMELGDQCQEQVRVEASRGSHAARDC